MDWQDSLFTKGNTSIVPDSCCKEPHRHCGENFDVNNIYTQVCILYKSRRKSSLQYANLENVNQSLCRAIRRHPVRICLNFLFPSILPGAKMRDPGNEVGLAAPNGGGQFVVAGGLAGYSLGRKKARNETPEK